MKFTTMEEVNELVELIDTSPNSISIENKTNLPLTRKQQNMLKNTNSYKACILLHPS